jgi:general secretion pathway protein D
VYGVSFALCALATAQPALGQEGTRLNYVNADIRDVIRSISAVLGINVLIAEDVSSERVTYSTSDPVPVRELGSVLEAILESENLVLVRKGPVAQVLPSERAPATGPVSFGRELPQPQPLGLVTQIVPLEFISPGDGIAVLEQLASPLARIEPVPRSNSILITDHASNLARYLELLRELDTRSDGESGLRTYVYRLQHATASELAMTLTQVYGVQAVQAALSPRVTSLSDQSLSNTLEGFRQRELQALDQRRATPFPITAAPITAGDSLASGETGGLVGNTTIVPDLATNALVIRTEPPNYPLLQETIEQLDVRPPQVLLEVAVTEVVLDEATQYGINWFAFTDEVGTNLELTGRLGQQRYSDSALAGIDDLVLRAVRLGDVDIRGVIRALASTSDLHVLSTPHIVALNNEQARILVGSQVPFSQSTRAGLDVVVDRVVQYRDVGTQLTIIPTINEDGYVTFRILQEVSQLTTQTLEAALNAPVISTREAETSALVRNGQTIVIGGLIDEAEEQVESGVPLLKDIPLLGYLFKSRTTRKVRTELAILVTPRVILTDEDAAAILEQTQERLENVPPPDAGGDRDPSNTP